jgi:hypothetical protein
MGGTGRTTAVTASPDRRARAASVDMAAAWLLDARRFHDEFAELFDGTGQHRGLERVRGRAVAIWADPDPAVRHYLATIQVPPPQEWIDHLDASHLGEWYRILMAPHLHPTKGLQSPGAVKDRLPDLGWGRSDARRVAFGRELCTLAQRYGDPAGAAALGSALPMGNKGWLSQQDLAGYRDDLAAIDEDRFHQHQNLVPLVQEIHQVLDAASAARDRVLLLPPG